MVAKKNPLSAPSSRKRILVVDDHPVLRGGLAQVINQQPDMMVCCEAADANGAMQRISAACPDLAVVDISLEGKSGLDLIKDIQALHPEVPILVMSMHDETLYAERVLRAGARGYVMKRAGGEAVLEAIRHILRGRIYVSQKMSALVLDRFAINRSAKAKSPIEQLTDREFEVFKSIGEGCTTREIARRMHISHKTVDVHRQHLKQKLNLPNTTSLLQHAVRWLETTNRG